MKSFRHLAERALPAITAAWVFIELLSLRLGLLNRFFFDAMHADVQGIDYFSLPKAWINLAAGRSAYDTFGQPTFGPHFTWYLSHPALAVVLGSWLARWEPMCSYGVFTMLSLVLMGAAAWLLARESSRRLTRRLIWLLMLGAFPTYWMLFVGNVQALLVLALVMLFTGTLRSLHGQAQGFGLVLGGLLLSLLTKPIVLLMLPLLLVLRETRRAASWALGAYAAVSALFLFVPALNPEPIGLRKIAWLTVHPQFVRENMNIYTNRFNVTPLMKDNSIHWFNLIAQSSTRLIHIDVMSLPVALDAMFARHMPAWPYDLVILTLVVLSFVVGRVRAQAQRSRAALLLLLTISLVFFLAYPTVWEYQYTAVLPVAAMLAVMQERGMLASPAATWLIALAACAWLPTLFFLTADAPATSSTILLISADRVIPVLLLFILLLIEIVRLLRQASLSKPDAVSV